MDDNNDKNLMELNTEEVQKKRERQEKIQEWKNKFKKWKEKRQEEKEDKKRAKEEEERVKRQEASFPELGPQGSKSSAFQEQTITNTTIQKETKRELTPAELRRQKAKRKKMIRNIMTIPEIIAVIFLAIFLKNRYVSYSNNVHQTLNYFAGEYVYDIYRDNSAIKISKNRKMICEQEPCNVENLGGYDIQFGKNQMRALRIFMDLTFMFKSNTKSITMNDIKTDFGRRCIYSMINNEPSFLEMKGFSGYDVIDYEQMSNYTTRGYKYELQGDRRFIYVSMGEKSTSGYALVVNSAYKKGDDIYFYIKEQTPDTVDASLTVITHPMIQIELKETPKEIYVINVETGEAFPNLDAPEQPLPTETNSGTNGVSDAINDLVGSLRDLIQEG